MTLVGAELDFLGASEQFESLKHDTLHQRRGNIFALCLGELVLRI